MNLFVSLIDFSSKQGISKLFLVSLLADNGGSFSSTPHNMFGNIAEVEAVVGKRHCGGAPQILVVVLLV